MEDQKLAKKIKTRNSFFNKNKGILFGATPIINYLEITLGAFAPFLTKLVNYLVPNNIVNVKNKIHYFLFHMVMKYLVEVSNGEK